MYRRYFLDKPVMIFIMEKAFLYTEHPKHAFTKVDFRIIVNMAMDLST